MIDFYDFPKPQFDGTVVVHVGHHRVVAKKRSRKRGRSGWWVVAKRWSRRGVKEG
jgi:hypothetical protein